MHPWFHQLQQGVQQTKTMKTKQINKNMSGSQAVIESLLKENVETVFGYPGGAIMPIYDALYDYRKNIHHILVRHEQGATHAAQGYARISGKTGVCLATSGPGATNLITGIADAQIDSTPLVCITGQVASNLLGTDAFQETDVVGISTPVTKWNTQVTKAEDIPKAIAKAFYLARTGRPGPVLVDITKDAQFGRLNFNYKPCYSIRSYVPNPKTDEKKITEAADLINKAKRPYVLFGQGVLLANAKKEFENFIEKGGIPSAWTLLGLSALPSDHPLNVGMLGMHGNYGPNLLTNKCDVLIAIGMRFDDRVTGDLTQYAKQAKVIHLEIDPAEIDKNVKTDVAIIGDCKTTLPLLTKQLIRKDHTKWLEHFRKLEQLECAQIKQNNHNSPNDSLSMHEVIKAVSDRSKGDAILVTDVGQHQMIAQRTYQFKKWRSNVTSGGLGTMGFALPAAFGAKIASPNREVIAVVGDGGFQMTIQELGTIFQSKANIKILLLNNEFLGMVRQWQELFFDKRYSFTTMINPDFQTIAKGYSIESKKITERKHLNSAIEKFLTHKGSYLLEVKVKKEENVFPMVPSGASVSEVRLN